jgi:hypothetical protein
VAESHWYVVSLCWSSSDCVVFSIIDFLIEFVLCFTSCSIIKNEGEKVTVTPLGNSNINLLTFPSICSFYWLIDKLSLAHPLSPKHSLTHSFTHSLIYLFIYMSLLLFIYSSLQIRLNSIFCLFSGCTNLRQWSAHLWRNRITSRKCLHCFSSCLTDSYELLSITLIFNFLSLQGDRLVIGGDHYFR